MGMLEQVIHIPTSRTSQGIAHDGEQEGGKIVFGFARRHRQGIARVPNFANGLPGRVRERDREALPQTKTVLHNNIICYMRIKVTIL